MKVVRRAHLFLCLFLFPWVVLYGVTAFVLCGPYLSLATKLPLQSDYLLMSPIRGISHLMHSPYLARQAARMVLGRPNSAITESAGKKDIMEARYWIEAPPCEGCPICDVSPDEDLIREDLASHVDGP